MYKRGAWRRKVHCSKLRIGRRQCADAPTGSGDAHAGTAVRHPQVAIAVDSNRVGPDNRGDGGGEVEGFAAVSHWQLGQTATRKSVGAYAVVGRARKAVRKMKCPFR